MPLPRRLVPAIPIFLLALATFVRAQAPTDSTARAPAAAGGVPGWVPLVLLLLTAGASAALLTRWRQLSVPVMRALVGCVAAALFLTGLTAGMWYLGRDARRMAATGAAATPWGVYHWLVIGLAALTIVFLLMFVLDSRRQPLVLESHWGGFGGGLGGIRLPSALVYLIAALGFGTMLTVISERLGATRTPVEELVGAGGREEPDSASDTVTVTTPADSAAPDPAAAAADTADPEP